MTAAPVPLAAMIEKVRRQLRYAQEDHTGMSEHLWSAVLATIQQHERDQLRIRQLDDENQSFMREVAEFRQQHERAMAALRDVESDLHMLRVAINSVDSYRELLVRVGDMERVIKTAIRDAASAAGDAVTTEDHGED